MNVLARFVARRWSSAQSNTGTAQQASALTKRRRFYKEVGIVEETENGQRQFKVTLDGRILKTQAGKVLKISSEPLALAVAEEWSSQEEFLRLAHMRLTGLSFTASDNPLKLTRESITAKVLEYLDGETVLFWNNESSKMEKNQIKYWQPVIDHANKEWGTSLKPVENLFETNVVSPADRRTVEKWLLSHNFWALTGIQYGVESLKSVLLPFNVLTFNITGEEAVHRATLEARTQAETWGSVEFFHGVEEEELTARLSASCLFAYFNSNSFTSIKA